MKKEILVNVGPLESRVAILEGNRLAEFHLERDPRIVGNIYKARVATVLPGMEAAFVDAGLDRHAFLSADDLSFEGTEGKEESSSKKSDSRRKSFSIKELKPDQEILIQVNRAAIGTKGARVSTRLALPGRYLVLLLTEPGRVGISRKIESEKVRDKLREIGEEICPEGYGIIMRTEAEGARKPQLKKDLKLLLEIKQQLYENAEKLSAPALVYEDLSLVFQIIRDSFSADVKRLLIDSKNTFEQAREIIGKLSPRLKSRVSQYKGKTGLFEHFDIEEDIAKLWQRRVWLKSGGYISIDPTEALISIDVNTARYTGRSKTSMPETILRTNLEAADEIARQMRLRDIGGIIVIDFIDMDIATHRTKVLRALQKAVTHDRAKTRMLTISHLGLVEMTRKKHSETLLEKISDICPECGGLGRVRNPVSIYLQIQRELRQLAKEKKTGALAVWVHPRVGCILVGDNGEQLKQMEAALRKPVYIRAHSATPSDYEVASLAPVEIEERVGQFVAGQQLQCRLLPATVSGLQDDLALSEEGFLVAFNAPIKLLDEVFTVELIAAGTSLGLGRVISGAVEEAVPTKPTVKKRGIRRRGMRRKQQPEAAAKEAPQPTTVKVTTEAPLEAGKEDKGKEDRPRRRHHRKKRTPEKEQQPKAVEEVAEKTTQKEEKSEATTEPTKRRRPRRRRKPSKSSETASEQTKETVEKVEPTQPKTEAKTDAEKPKPRRPRRRYRGKSKTAAKDDAKSIESKPSPAALVDKPKEEKTTSDSSDTKPIDGDAKTADKPKPRRRYYRRKKKAKPESSE